MAASAKNEHDYIPKNFQEFDAFYKNYCQIVNARTTGSTPAWTHIPAARVTDLSGGYAAWYNAWSAYKDDKTKVKLAAARTAQKEGAGIVREFTNEFIRYSRAVSDDDKRLLGVHIPDPTPSPIPDPATRPEFSLRVKDIRKIRIDFQDQGSERRAKPYGMDGAVVHWLVSDHAAQATGELTGSVLATRTPFTLEFADADRGKILSVALQWQNEKGRKGSFSEIQNTIIP
ncbi:MAG: hypothetical protein LBI86_03825 [Treponema sp.]|jgi:hypothetical protein|nr:hypothetical protein [Treponema sp.]